MIALNLILILMRENPLLFLFPNVFAFSILLFIASTIGDSLDKWLTRKALQLWGRMIKARLLEVYED